MSAPKVIVELVFTGLKVLGKATAAAGSQAVRNFKHKPEGAPESRPVGAGSSKSQITNQLNMSMEEAYLILNVKKDDPMEVIQKHYDHIFAANSPPPPPTTPASTPTPTTAAARSAAKASKVPTHSHYLQSKVYRALERIKAERSDGVAPPDEQPAPEAAAGSAESSTPGAATGAGESR